jgi:hypothetical protein
MVLRETIWHLPCNRFGTSAASGDDEKRDRGAKAARSKGDLVFPIGGFGQTPLVAGTAFVYVRCSGNDLD